MNYLDDPTGLHLAPVPGIGLPDRHEGSTADGLVGRTREATHIDQLLWAARRGRARALALRGEPGVGKTALIHGAVARASDFTVLQLRGTAAGPKSAAREWPEPLALLLRRQSAAAHASGGGPAALVDAGPDGQGAAEAAEALRTLASNAGKPVLITLDDCQVLPPSFPRALAQAVTEGNLGSPTALLLAWRDLPFQPSLELGVPAVPEHVLGAIDFDGSGELLERLGLPVPRWHVLKQLVRAVAGNPFALLQTVGRLGDEVLSGARELPKPVPVGTTVAESFEGCLAELDEDAREVAAAAATGAPVPILASALLELDLEPKLLETLQATGLVTMRSHRIDFNHPLVRAAAYELVDPDRRDEIQMALARAYADRGYVERSAVHASQLHTRPRDDVRIMATHAAQVSLTRGDRARAAMFQEVAGEFASSPVAAASHLAQAVPLWASTGHRDRATACVERAEAVANLPDPLRADLAWRKASLTFVRTGQVEMVGRMAAAAELCARDAPGDAVLMLIDAAACQLLAPPGTEAIALARRAAQIARGVSSHSEVLADATLAIARTYSGQEEPDDRKRIQAVAMMLGQTQGFPGSPSVAFMVGQGLVINGNWTLAARWARWIAQCATTAGDQALGLVPPVLLAKIALEEGRIAEAIEQAQLCAETALEHHEHLMAARALSVLAGAHAATGAYSAGFETAARVFALDGDVGRIPRIRTLIALAVLDLQRSRWSSAAAWARAAVDELGIGEGGEGVDIVSSASLPAIAEVLSLARRSDELPRRFAAMGESPPAGPAVGTLFHGVRRLDPNDPERSAARFERTMGSLERTALVSARYQLSWAVRLAQSGQWSQARHHAGAAREAFVAMGASGWALLARRELEAIDERLCGQAPAEPPEMPGTQAVPVVVAPEPQGPGDQVPAITAPPWELELLGTFAVRHQGELVQIPFGLAVQGLKIVAIRQQILVEELVELLWPGAEPGVGMRRLRNVLWRIRSACGDILERRDNFLTLAEAAVVDADVFRRLAANALGRDIPKDKAAHMAREALEHYQGELLPGDRYADWATGPRESLSRLHIQLLELLVGTSLDEDEEGEAVSLLNRLIEAEPYEEHNHLQLAELYLRTGNRARALAVLERAEQVLDELGLPASAALLRIRTQAEDPKGHLHQPINRSA